MATIQNLRPVGDRLLMTYSDNTVRWFTPTGTGLYVPSSHSAAPVVPQGAGDTGVDNSNGVNPTPPGNVAAPSDDYPWPNAPEAAFSPLRYSYRDCTDFVAWRINRDAGVTHSPWKWTWGNLRISNGDAIGWRPDWITHGWGHDITPVAGCIGWYGTSAGAYGHVFYIQAVTSTQLVIEQYNWGGTQAYSTATIPRYAIDSSHSYLAMPPS